MASTDQPCPARGRAGEGANVPAPLAIFRGTLNLPRSSTMFHTVAKTHDYPYEQPCPMRLSLRVVLAINLAVQLLYNTAIDMAIPYTGYSSNASASDVAKLFFIGHWVLNALVTLWFALKKDWYNTQLMLTNLFLLILIGLFVFAIFFVTIN
jgi:hypothetical protein